jgi:hypothetical protein
MPLRPEVRDAQRTLATLDAAHRRAVARLNQVLARRTELIAQQNDYVATAQTEVDEAVVAMASEVSVELTAHLLDVDAADVRRLVKASSSAASRRRNANGSLK